MRDSSFAAGGLQLRLANYLLATLIIAVLANVAANYLGRGRHFENTARIRELEAERRGMNRSG